MKILFLTISWPERGQNNLYTDLISEFRDRGHDMHVVCNRPRRSGLPTSYKNEEGIQVLRVKTGNISKTNPLEKSISLLLLGGQFKRAIKKYLNEEEFDLILFNTPPITLSGLLEKLKKKYDCPLYLLLKDIWPYGFVDHGLIKKDGWIYNYFRKHEKRLYELSDKIGCMSPKGVEFVQDKYPKLNKNKVEVCPNSIRVPDEESETIESQKIRSKYGIPEDATVFIFSGNLGLGHGLGFLVEAILKLRDYEKAFFLIGGAGTYFSKMKEVFDEEDLPNALLYSYLPEEDYQELISNCDVGLILLNSQYSYPQFPSRLLSYLANKMAVLCAVNKETDIGEIVEKQEVGISTIHGDFEQFKQAVVKLCENKQAVRKMGKQGFELLKNDYSVDQSYKTIMQHFEK